MDVDYDGHKARQMLLRIYEVNRAKRSEGIVNLMNLNTDELQFETIKWPPSVRLMTEEIGRDDSEEMVLKMQGILCSMILPPLRSKPRTSSLSHIRNLRQHVKLTALGMDQFEEVWDKVKDVTDAFARYLPGQTIPPPEFLPYEGDRSIEAHARYFTDRKLIPHEKNEPFMPGVDAHGILRSIQPDVFIHGSDNRVEYCRTYENKEGLIAHKAYKPELFKPGDIVEIVFSFVGVPIKDGKHRVLLNLRALTLLNSEIREASGPQKSLSVRAIEQMPKRKRLYLSENTQSPPPPHGKRSRVEPPKCKPVEAAVSPINPFDDALDNDIGNGYSSGSDSGCEDGEIMTFEAGNGISVADEYEDMPALEGWDGEALATMDTREDGIPMQVDNWDLNEYLEMESEV